MDKRIFEMYPKEHKVFSALLSLGYSREDALAIMTNITQAARWAERIGGTPVPKYL